MSSPAADKLRYYALKAAGRCVDCAVSRTVKGYVRCFGCQQKQKRYNVFGRITFDPPAEQLSPEALYQAVRHERELTSWAWKNPA